MTNAEDINMKDQCSFPLHCWLSVAAVVSVVVAVAVAGAIDAAEPEPGRDAAPVGFADSDKDYCQRKPMPMENSFDEIRSQYLQHQIHCDIVVVVAVAHKFSTSLVAPALPLPRLIDELQSLVADSVVDVVDDRASLIEHHVVASLLAFPTLAAYYKAS
ncbi:hypothetical protein K7X08_017463 [Anisodus acutangulus]|uniref:Uncharacterized protein n=1 Tax=Anisodus acutangulus TaxID=402998 RepID=A0A9Q1LWI2_9SOLA|nr:hypothetical protein K7X08_017463 [Anisodus acutangulus]